MAQAARKRRRAAQPVRDGACRRAPGWPLGGRLREAPAGAAARAMILGGGRILERLTANLADAMAREFARFKKTPGGTGTRFIALLGARAAEATQLRADKHALTADNQQLRNQVAALLARTAAPDVDGQRATFQREAADIAAERESWQRERAGWAEEQKRRDAALLATADELARLQTLVDALTANWDALLKRFLEVATAGVPEAIERRAEARSWAHCVAHLDNPEILARVIQAGMAAGQFNGVIEARAQALFRQHLAAADEAARRQAQADALAAIKAKGRAERARYRY